MSQIKEKPLRLTELARLPHSVSSGGNEWRMCCPVHGGNNSTAFCLSLTSGLYHCFACGAGGRLLEFWERGGPNPETNAHLIFIKPRSLDENRLKAGRNVTTKSIKALENNPLKAESAFRGQVRMKVAQTRLALLACNRDATGREIQTVLNYLKQRSISLETALRLGVGYEPTFSFRVTQKVTVSDKSADHPLRNRRVIAPALLFPLYDPETGDFLNFYARGISPTESRLHYVGRGHKGLFNAEVVKLTSTPNLAQIKEKTGQKVAPLLVVEGVFDALAWLEAGYGRVVALTGTSLLNLEWFRKAGQVILAFDNDPTGQLAQEKARQILTGMGIPCSSLVPQFYQGHKDFADLWKGQVSHRNKLCNLAQFLHCSGFSA